MVLLLLAPGPLLGTAPTAPARAPTPLAVASRSIERPTGDPGNLSANGATVRTLDLFNGSLENGLVNGINAPRPSAILYDPFNGTLWITAGGWVGEFAAPGAAGLRWDTVGLSTAQMAFDNRTESVLVTDSGGGTVTSLNASSSAVNFRISVRQSPEGIAFDRPNDTAYVANEGNGTVSILNATSGRVLKNLTVGKSPTGVAYDAANELVFVGNYGSANVSVINASQEKVVSSIAIPSSMPGQLLFNAGKGSLYVAGTVSGAIDAFNPATGKLQRTYQAGIQDTAIAINSNGSTLFVADSATNEVYAVNTASGVAGSAIGLGTSADPVGLEFAPPSTLEILDAPLSPADAPNVTTASVSGTTLRTIGRAAIDHYPSAEVSVPSLDSLFVYDGGSGDLEWLNASTYAEERAVYIGVGVPGLAYPDGLAYDPSGGGYLFVSYSSAVGSGVDEVAIGTSSVVATFPAGIDPAGVLYDPATSDAYIVNHGGDNLTVIETADSNAAKSVPLGDDPTEAALDPSNGLLYVTNSASENVSVINASTLAVEPSVRVGSGPLADAYDPALDRVLVANGGSQNLTLIDPATGTTAGSIGLPANELEPTQVAVDPANGTLEVEEWAVGQPNGELVFVNETNLSFAAAVAVGTDPTSLVYDPATDLTVVGSEDDGTLSLVNYSLSGLLAIRSFAPLYATIYLGDPAEFTVNTTGGLPPFDYAYAGLPPGCATNDSTTIDCTPNATGTFEVTAFVNDSIGEHVHASTNLTVLVVPPPLNVSLAAVPDQIALGNVTVVRANASGGAPPYGYWYVELPPGCRTQNVSALDCTPSAIGNFSLEVRVNDSGGNISTALAWVNVTANGSVSPPPPLAIASFTATPDSFDLGGTTALNVSATGGRTPYAYAFSGLPSGCLSEDRAAFDCDPAVSGNFTVTVNVTDASGRSVHASVTFSVESPGRGSTVPVTPSSMAPTTLEIEVGIAAAVLILVGIIAYAVRSRRPPPAPPGPS